MPDSIAAAAIGMGCGCASRLAWHAAALDQVRFPARARVRRAQAQHVSSQTQRALAARLGRAPGESVSIARSRAHAAPPWRRRPTAGRWTRASRLLRDSARFRAARDPQPAARRPAAPARATARRAGRTDHEASCARTAVSEVAPASLPTCRDACGRRRPAARATPRAPAHGGASRARRPRSRRTSPRPSRPHPRARRDRSAWRSRRQRGAAFPPGAARLASAPYSS